LKKKGFKEERATKNRVGRPWHIHDPGIQQEPFLFLPHPGSVHFCSFEVPWEVSMLPPVVAVLLAFVAT
jgi:hypothetical protein